MRISRVVGIVAIAALVVSCGGDDGGSPPPAGNPAAPTPPPAPPPAGATTVSIVGDRGDQSFSPNPATAQGRTIAWKNDDDAVHRIMSNDGSFDTGNIAPGATSAAVTLATDGANYHCTIHPGMIGAVNSAGGAPPPCTGIYC